MSKPGKRSRPAGLSLGKKAMFGLIVTCGFFVAVELSLTLLGFGQNTPPKDPFVGFSKRIPLLEQVTDEQGQVQLRTATNKLVWFNDQQFPLQKPAGTRRVFCLGGSTTFGRPFSDATSFCGWLRELLPLADGSTKWEVINAGGVSYASYRVAVVMEELAQYEPDLFIIYTGQNEFLERRTYPDMFDTSDLSFTIASAFSRTRTWSLLDSMIHSHNTGKSVQLTDTLPGEVDEILNHTIGPSDYHRDDGWRTMVLHHYEINLRRMVAISRNAGAKIVFVVPASNEKDCSPFKSELRTDVDPTRVEALLEQATSEAADNEWQRSIDTLRQAQQIDDQYALCDYKLGQALFALGASDEAQRAFQRALNADICPLRAPHDFLAAVRDIATEQDVPLVDFDKKLRERCQQKYGHSILGDEYFLDHVHPTIDTHRQLAMWILDSLQTNSLIQGSMISDSQQQVVYERVLGGLDIQQQGVALRNLGKVFHWAGKFDEAAARARDALRCLPDDPESLLVLANCLVQTKHSDQAEQTFQHLIQVAPLYARGYLSYGELLLEMGDYEQARDHLSMAVALLPVERPRHWRAAYFLAVAHIKLEEFDKAVTLLEQTDAAVPNDANTLCLLAQAKASLNETDAAISLYERAIDLGATDVDSLNHLGSLMLKTGRPADALRHFEAVLAINPTDARANSGRVVALALIRSL